MHAERPPPALAIATSNLRVHVQASKPPLALVHTRSEGIPGKPMQQRAQGRAGNPTLKGRALRCDATQLMLQYRRNRSTLEFVVAAADAEAERNCGWQLDERPAERVFRVRRLWCSSTSIRRRVRADHAASHFLVLALLGAGGSWRATHTHGDDADICLVRWLPGGLRVALSPLVLLGACQTSSLRRC